MLHLVEQELRLMNGASSEMSLVTLAEKRRARGCVLALQCFGLEVSQSLMGLLPTLLLLLVLDLPQLLSSLLLTLSPGFMMWRSDHFGRLLMALSLIYPGKSRSCLEKLVYSSFSQVVGVR